MLIILIFINLFSVIKFEGVFRGCSILFFHTVSFLDITDKCLYWSCVTAFDQFVLDLDGILRPLLTRGLGSEDILRNLLCLIFLQRLLTLRRIVMSLSTSSFLFFLHNLLRSSFKIFISSLFWLWCVLRLILGLFLFGLIDSFRTSLLFSSYDVCKCCFFAAFGWLLISHLRLWRLLRRLRWLCWRLAGSSMLWPWARRFSYLMDSKYW